MARDSGLLTFDVHAEAVTQGLDDLAKVLAPMMYEVGRELQGYARFLLNEVITDAAERADEGGGFPEPFQRHLIHVARGLPIEIAVSSSAVSVAVDFELLGNRDDLERAFHQGARLKSGGYVWGPWHGNEGSLKQPNAGRRYLYWEAIFNGEEEVEIGGRVRAVEGSWEDTMEQRISIWGNKAPEWLYVQFGQSEWEPTIPPGDILEEFETFFYEEAVKIMGRKLDEALDFINNYQMPVGAVYPVYKNGKLTQGRLAESGRYTFAANSGKYKFASKRGK